MCARACARARARARVGYASLEEKPKENCGLDEAVRPRVSDAALQRCVEGAYAKIVDALHAEK